MKFYKFVLYKNYFDTGYGITSYLKYAIALVVGGGAIMQQITLNQILIIGIVYAVFCFFLGWFWIENGFLDAQNEVGNQHNPLSKQLRAALKLTADLKEIKRKVYK